MLELASYVSDVREAPEKPSQPDAARRARRECYMCVFFVSSGGTTNVPLMTQKFRHRLRDASPPRAAHTRTRARPSRGFACTAHVAGIARGVATDHPARDRRRHRAFGVVAWNPRADTMSSSPEGSEIAEEVDHDDVHDDASDEPPAVSPSPSLPPLLSRGDRQRRTVSLVAVPRRGQPAPVSASAPAPLASGGLVPLDASDRSSDDPSDEYNDATFEEESVEGEDHTGDPSPSPSPRAGPREAASHPSTSFLDGSTSFPSPSPRRPAPRRAPDSPDSRPLSILGEESPTERRGGAFRWGRSPSPTSDDGDGLAVEVAARAAAEAELARTVPSTAGSRPSTSAATPPGGKRRKPPRGLTPERLAALVARAKSIAARRDAAGTGSGSGTDGSDRRDEPAVVPALTMARLHAMNLSARVREEARAVSREIEAMCSNARRRLTPAQARAAYAARAARRLAAEEGARRAAETLATSDEDARAALAEELERSLPEGAAKRAVREGWHGKGDVHGDGDGDGGGGFRFGSGGGLDDAGAPGTPPRAGRGRLALLRRLYASHRLREEAEEALEGEGATIDPPPASWARLHRGPAAEAAFPAGAGYDSDRDAYGAAFDRSFDAASDGEASVAMLRASAELRRRARAVLGEA